MDQNMQAQMVTDQTMRVSPTLIMVNQLLALSSQELLNMVHAELEQNPALESTENNTCPSCGSGTTGTYCPDCMQPVRGMSSLANAAPGSAVTTPSSGSYDDGYDPEDYRPRDFASYTAGEDDFDPLSLVASEASMAEQLLADLIISLPQEDHAIAAYLVGNLDDQGFMGCTVEGAAERLGVSVQRVERVLKVLQITGPAGVGARDLRECLLIQLEDLSARETVTIAEFVYEVIADHLTDLGEHKFTIIAQALGTSYEKVVGVRDFIKQHLQPRPLQEPPQGHAWRSPSPTRFVIPDVLIRERDGQLEAEVVETSRFSLRINPLYQRLATAAAPAAGAGGDISEVEREHIRRYVNRSKLFISNIKQRRETMHRITTCLILLQEDFIRHGVRYLRALTRAQVAQYLGIHESTVSRATANKYLMLPNKQVIPFSDFFSASLSAKDVIRELILKEAAPMTDKDIVMHLRDQGIRVARRTVTKYRNQLGIMPSTFR
jgi:RNA polymerase sigma-54 factor